jgi:hypothetical protein
VLPEALVPEAPLSHNGNPAESLPYATEYTAASPPNNVVFEFATAVHPVIPFDEYANIAVPVAATAPATHKRFPAESWPYATDQTSQFPPNNAVFEFATAVHPVMPFDEYANRAVPPVL